MVLAADRLLNKALSERLAINDQFVRLHPELGQRSRFVDLDAERGLQFGRDGWIQPWPAVPVRF